MVVHCPTGVLFLLVTTRAVPGTHNDVTKSFLETDVISSSGNHLRFSAYSASFQEDTGLLGVFISKFWSSALRPFPKNRLFRGNAGKSAG